MKLYELQDQLVQIDAILEQNTNEETQEILESAKEEILKQIDGKIENILDYIADCKAKADQLRTEVVRLTIKRTSLDKKTEYLKNMLLWYMKSVDKKKESFGNWDITVAKTAGKVVIDNEELVPLSYLKQTYTIDKDLLKTHMKETDGRAVVFDEQGNPIVFAHIEEGESLRIK